MVSLGVMTIAAMAIFAMQQQLVQAGTHARKMTIATQIAQNLIERLKMDALRWTVVGPPPATTDYLKFVGATGTIANFQTLPTFTATRGGDTRLLSNAFNYYGDDLNNVNGAPDGLTFCASYRLNWVFNNMRLIRADVRVWWAREGQSAIATDYPKCADTGAPLNPGGANFDRYHIVYLSTVLRAAL